MRLTETMLRKIIQEELSNYRQFNVGDEVTIKTTIPYYGSKKKDSSPSWVSGSKNLVIIKKYDNGMLVGLPAGSDDEDELISFSIDDIINS